MEMQIEHVHDEDVHTHTRVHTLENNDSKVKTSKVANQSSDTLDE